MSFSQIYTRSSLGLLAPEIQVEVHLSGGLPALTMVGLPEAAVRESKDRVRSAIMNSGYSFPQRRVTINLAPADLPKDGSRLDLPIALGILVANNQIPENGLQDYECLGELALNGDIRPIQGILSVARACAKSKRKLLVPKGNAAEAARIQGVQVYGVSNLREACLHINGKVPLESAKPIIGQSTRLAVLDLADVKGQYRARRALEITAAGGHSILFVGPPGTGKTLLASRLAGIMPALSEDDALEVASIYSIANMPHEYGIRPFRAPHHTASAAALVGGGSNPKPGEITLSHLGVLFLDELPEFDRRVLEVLRQPLESKEVVISRATRQVTYPADFQLVAAMNPCPCGYFGDPSAKCSCSPDAINRYKSKLSGPLLDRIDLHIDVPALPATDLQNSQPAEPSSAVRARVLAAYNIQVQRQKKCNYALKPQELEQFASLTDDSKQLMGHAQQKMALSARSYHRILRVARTIADLAGSPKVALEHITEAISYRC